MGKRQPGAGIARIGVAVSAIGISITLMGAFSASAGASGEFTTAVLDAPVTGTDDLFVWTYTFHQNGGHGLSNIAIGFCDDVLAHVVEDDSYEVFTSGDVPGGHTGFGPGVKFPYTGATGSLSVVFDQPFAIDPAGLRIQSHSGDGQQGDAVQTAPGPGPCDPDATTTTTSVPDVTTTLPDPTTTVPEVTTTLPDPTTTVPDTTTTTAAPVTTTTVPDTVPEPTTTTAVPASTSSTLDVATSVPEGTTTTGAVAVLGVQSFTDPGDSARGGVLAATGSNSAGTLTLAGVAILLLGLNLMLVGHLRRPLEWWR